MQASNTLPVDCEKLRPHAMTYNGPNGSMDTITAGPDANGSLHRQTLTYTNGNLTNISDWVKV